MSLVPAYQKTFPKQYILDYRDLFLDTVIFNDERIFEIDISSVVHWRPYNRSRPTSFRSQMQYKAAVFGAT